MIHNAIRTRNTYAGTTVSESLIDFVQYFVERSHHYGKKSNNWVYEREYRGSCAREGNKRCRKIKVYLRVRLTKRSFTEKTHMKKHVQKRLK